MKKLLLLLTFVQILVFFVLATGKADATTIVCPLTPQADRQIIILNNDYSPRYLVANGTAANALWGPVSSTVPSGNYDVTLVSFDYRPERTAPRTQHKETWFFKFKDAYGNIVARTNTINDLPESQNWLTQKVNYNLYIPPSAISMAAFHGAYFDSNPNSVYPVCVALDRISPKFTSASLSSLNGLSGTSSFTTTLKATALYTGPLADKVNYTFWWNCDSASTDIAYLRRPSVCGEPTDPAFGLKYDGQPGGTATTSKTTPGHTYPSGFYTPKVVIERGTASPVEERARITVYNNPPRLSNAAVSEPDYCFSGPTGNVSWNYADTENDAQSFYRLQVDTLSGSFTNPVYDSAKQPSSGLPSASIPPGELEFNQEYQARVMVWDSFGSASSWENVPASWKTPQHSYPRYVPFTSEVDSISRSSVQYNFFNQSICYDGNNLATACGRWEYDFDYLSGTDSFFNPDPSHTYFSTGTYQIKETVVDADGYICSGSPQEISVNLLPSGPVVWREVSPF